MLQIVYLNVGVIQLRIEYSIACNGLVIRGEQKIWVPGPRIGTGLEPVGPDPVLVQLDPSPVPKTRTRLELVPVPNLKF